MTTTIETTERRRPGRRTNEELAARAAMQDGTSGETTGTESVPPIAPQEAPDPFEQIQAAIDAVPESEMGDWTIKILCQSIVATQYRQMFRAAAEHSDGEARVYCLLRLMTRNCLTKHHNSLCMAAANGVASARINGHGIDMGEHSCRLLTAMDLANKVSRAAKTNCRLQDLDKAVGPVEAVNHAG